ncbi:523_t:CDS:2 [Ambispora gerdemannii]|uniref:ASTRA-associated protein 1 n=1 Tax=Ambispora gerdemannii TaxID=144530 RepID=A0A9N8YI31_9GLOM|nr:523_t:CDS:2 [Ambispora gerdemannii]
MSLASSSNRKPSSKAAPTPEYIFRGHTDQISVLKFYQNNKRLLSGDAEGNIIIWDMKIRRPLLKFKAHHEGILNISTWKDFLISQGRDNKIHVWNNESDVLINAASDPLKPMFSLTVNSLNFCQFSIFAQESENAKDLLIAVPNLTNSAGIDIWDLLNQQRLIDGVGIDENSGYCMSIRLFNKSDTENQYYILAAYENGNVVLWKIDCSSIYWTKCWTIKEHSESALSVDISRDKTFAISVSGDNKIIKYEFSESIEDPPIISQMKIKTPGISYVCIRSDSKIFATAGWDARRVFFDEYNKNVRVFSAKNLKPLAILSYHNESVHALAFAELLNLESDRNVKDTSKLANKDQNLEVCDSNNNLEDIANEQQPKHHYLVAGGKDSRISLWEIY